MFRWFISALRLVWESFVLSGSGFQVVTGARAFRNYKYWDVPLAGVPNAYAVSGNDIVISDSSRRIWGIIGPRPEPATIQKALDKVATSGESSDPDLEMAASQKAYYIGTIANMR